MHPAPSMIVFTALSGLGLGMMAWIGIGLGPDEVGFGWLASVLVMALSGAGGLASVGHLGNPSNAWRAFSQWRSSWLSREACLMILSIAAYGLYALIWLFGGERVAPLGWLSAALALATVYSTAMIYGQLRTIPMWSSTPTRWLFLGLSIAGGYMAAAGAVGLWGGAMPLGVGGVAVIALGAVVIGWWQMAATASGRRGATGSTIESATGLGGIGKVRLLEPPHSGKNYLLSEMAYSVGRKRSNALRLIGLVFGVALPLVLGALALSLGAWLLIVALLCHIAGVLALRWLFFAEAEHVQALYYGMR